MAGTNTHTFKAIRGKQAGRSFYTAMCTLKSIAKIFTFNDADIPAEHRAQRTLRKSRIPRIRDYILQNPGRLYFLVDNRVSRWQDNIQPRIPGEAALERYPFRRMRPY